MIETTSLSAGRIQDALLKLTTQSFHVQVSVNVFADVLERRILLISRFLPRHSLLAQPYLDVDVFNKLRSHDT